MTRFSKLTIAILLTSAPFAAQARDWPIKMLNRGSDGTAMVFEPAFLVVKPGDTVTFIAADKGHNAESMATMSPAGSVPFKGKVNEQIVVKFTKQGLYGYKCLPHLAMGMVGLIQVGTAANKPQILAESAKLPGLSKRNMTALVARAR